MKQAAVRELVLGGLFASFAIAAVLFAKLGIRSPNTTRVRQFAERHPWVGNALLATLVGLAIVFCKQALENRIWTEQWGRAVKNAVWAMSLFIILLVIRRRG